MIPQAAYNAGAGQAQANSQQKKQKAAQQAAQPRITPSPTGQVHIQAPPPPNQPGPIQQVKAPPPVAPPPPSIHDYLAGDTAYNDYLMNSKKQLSDLRAQQNSDRNMHSIDFANQQTQMGQNRERDLASLLEDYAGRGLAQSGLYSDAYGDLNTQYDEMGNQLQAGNTQYEQALNDALLAAQQGATNGKMDAKQAALARRAADIKAGG